MDNEVKWLFSQGEIGPNDIRQVEEELGIKLPADYKAFVAEKNGAQPVPDTLRLPNGEELVFNSLLHFGDPKGNLLDAYADVKPRLPEQVIPFANDPFGNYFCFDLRPEATQLVLFWDHEKDSLRSVAESFSGLLEMLRM